MNTQEFVAMIKDKHFFELKRMQHKYSSEKVREMLDTLREMSYAELELKDFAGNNCVYLPAQSIISGTIIKKLIADNTSKEIFASKAMEEEIESTFRIENIESAHESVHRIMQGFAPQNKEEYEILGMKMGLEFIGDPKNMISEENLHLLYLMAIGNFLEGENALPRGSYYRDQTVYIVGDKPYHEGLSPKLLPKYMKELIQFANQKDEIPELVKAGILHFYIAYLHPYFDGNGRTARLVHLWYLVQQGFSSTLFYTISKHISSSKREYYKSFLDIEENYKISKLLDITPFINYLKKNVYRKISEENNEEFVMKEFILALREGKITEKEYNLWNFVLSFYGMSSFSTKQLEKDFGGAAYATIRAFVLKFENLNLLTAQHFGKRVKYCIKK